MLFFSTCEGYHSVLFLRVLPPVGFSFSHGRWKVLFRDPVLEMVPCAFSDLHVCEICGCHLELLT